MNSYLAAAMMVGMVTATTTPVETLFFRYPVVSVDRLGSQTESQIDTLRNALDASVSSGSVLEYRILSQVADQESSPVSPFSYWTEIWYNGAAKFAAYHSSLVPVSNPSSDVDKHMSRQHLHVAGIGSCKLCRSSAAYKNVDLSTQRHGYFVNNQTQAAYPIQATFQSAFPLTAAEPGTLDYEVSIGLASVTATDLKLQTELVNFFEVYENSAAFGQHVVNVNKTLMVEGAPHWFTDLGNTGALWFQIVHQSEWCSFCEQPAANLWAGAFTNPGKAPGPKADL